MANIHLKLQAKVIGLFSKIDSALSFNKLRKGDHEKSHKANNIELENRNGQYSAVMRSPTASPMSSPSNGKQ